MQRSSVLLPRPGPADEADRLARVDLEVAAAQDVVGCRSTSRCPDAGRSAPRPAGRQLRRALRERVADRRAGSAVVGRSSVDGRSAAIRLSRRSWKNEKTIVSTQ